MARDFTRNLANYMSLGVNAISPLASGASKITIAAFIRSVSYTAGGNDNRVVTVDLNNGAVGILLSISGAAGAEKVRCGGRSQTADGFLVRSGATTVSTSVWHHVGGVLDISGDTIRCYLNGAQDASGANTFGAATYTPGTPTKADSIGADIGAPPATSTQFDGRIAELALWSNDITTAGFAMLNQGYSPLFVLPSALICYWPIIGSLSPEIELRNGKIGTITGSLPAAAHPRIFYPSPQLITEAPTAPAVTPSSGRLRRRSEMAIFLNEAG